MSGILFFIFASCEPLICIFNSMNICLYSRAAKVIHCAQNFQTVRLCTEFNKSINNIFLICHILWHFQDGRHWPWEFHMGQKLKHAPISLKIMCLVFKLHKIIGQRSFQICTGSQNLKLLWFWWIIPQIVCINTYIQKQNSFVYLRWFDCDLWPVKPFIHMVCV